MNLILRKALTEIEGFGTRPLTETDFYRECAARGFEVVELSMYACNGITMWVRGRVVIAISLRLRGHDRLKTMWHEFGHALLHVPGVSAGALFSGVTSLMTRKQEKEVDDFVSIALTDGR